MLFKRASKLRDIKETKENSYKGVTNNTLEHFIRRKQFSMPTKNTSRKTSTFKKLRKFRILKNTFIQNVYLTK